MEPAEAFQAIADLESRLAKKRGTLVKAASAPAYILCQSTLASVAAEAVSLAKALKDAVDVAAEWYGVNYWLAARKDAA